MKIFILAVTFWSLTSSSISFANSATLSKWAFTNKIINSTPSTEIKMSSLSDEDIYVFTQWDNLLVKLYEVETQIFDGDSNLVGYSKYGFKPDKTTWDSWTRYHFRPGKDQPGEWRFVVSLNGEKVLDEIIYIEE